ncbi:hypothetical protein C8R44DRAFT_813743 [Mycena epipterygia]|nr:hypothetical protein C8R44DRAFT_813743 [Mycena epipterygia]
MTARELGDQKMKRKGCHMRLQVRTCTRKGEPQVSWERDTARRKGKNRPQAADMGDSVGGDTGDGECDDAARGESQARHSQASQGQEGQQRAEPNIEILLIFAVNLNS